jgi:RHS repeat-associated protein
MPVTNYIWDELNDTVLMETDGSGNPTVVYTNEPGRFGGLISQRQGGQPQYYHYDALGSTRQLTDSTGQVTDTYLYDAFGNTIQSTGTSVVPYHFVGRQGYYYDQELGEYYVRARQYAPTLARWLSLDPFDRRWGTIGHNVGILAIAGDVRAIYEFISSYAYAKNNALDYVDPSAYYEISQGTGDGECNEDQTWCIRRVLSSLKKTISQRIKEKINCFAVPKNQTRAGGKETTCRAELMQCVLDTINSGITFECKDLKSRGEKGDTTGSCIESKNKPVAGLLKSGLTGAKCPCDPDPGCKACGDELLANSQITLDTAGDAIPKDCEPSQMVPGSKLYYFVDTVLHELLHNCVGGHLQHPEWDAKCGRPDPYSLVSDFRHSDCGKGPKKSA